MAHVATKEAEGPRGAAEVSEEVSIWQAAWQLEDAINERSVERYPTEEKAREEFFKWLKSEAFYSRSLLVLFTMFETPTWCVDGTNTWSFPSDGESRCHDPPDARNPGGPYLLSGVPYLPPGCGIIVEVFIIGFFAYKTYLEYNIQVRYFAPIGMEYFKMWMIKCTFGVLGLWLIDCVVFLVFMQQIRLAFIARSTILFLQTPILKLVDCIRKILPDVLSVFIFFVGFIIFFGFVSWTIFTGMEDLKGKDAEAAKDFDDFWPAVKNLFAAGVCDEFVEILIKSYTQFRPVGILWLLHLLIVHMLFLNLVLDTLVAGYHESDETNKEATIRQKAMGIISAFNTLSKSTGGEQVSKETFFKFVKELGRSPHMLDFPDQKAEIAFGVVDTDGSGSVEIQEFAHICQVIQYEYWDTRKYSALREWAPKLWNSKIGQALVTTVEDSDSETKVSTLDWFMNWVLTVNLMLVVVEGYFELIMTKDAPQNLVEALGYVEFFFSFIYLGECMIKIGVRGWRYYMATGSNQFDLFTTLLLLGTSTLDFFLEKVSFMKTFSNIFRTFRLIRVIKQAKRLQNVQFMVDTIAKIVIKAKAMLLLLSAALFAFSMISVQLFGGKLSEGFIMGSLEAKGVVAREGHNWVWKEEKPSYLEDKELALNCNDFIMAFGFWFVFLLCEYKPSYKQVVDLVAYPFTGWIFIAFYVLSVMIVFELVKAFTIEAYMELKADWDEKQKCDVVEPDALIAIKEVYDKAGKKLWYKNLSDEREQQEVQEEIEEILKGEEEGEEHGEHAGHGGEHGGGHHEGHGGALASEAHHGGHEA